MPWDWQEYVRLANGLIPATFATLDDQARVRSVVSRAYYGAFNTAKRYAIQKHLYVPAPKQKRIKHGDVWNSFFQRQCTEREKQVGVLGDALMDDRHDADYEFALEALNKIGQSAVLRANTICTLLGQPIAGLPAVSITIPP